MSDQRVHVVHIIPTLRFGGAERFVVGLVNNSDHSLFRYTIITFFSDTPLAVQLNLATQIHVVPKRGQISWHLFGDLRRALSGLKPDIVHTHLFGGDLWGRVAARELGIPVVTTEHNINQDESFMKTFIKKRLRNLSASYTAPSEAIQNYMRQAYRITRSITVIPHGIELDSFLSIPVASLDSGRPIKLLMLGRLAKQKGHRVALDALRQLRSYRWKLTIIGDGKELAAIKQLISSWELADRVSIQPATTHVPEVLADTDVFIMPSLWEGLGIAAMEAMAAGRVVIAANVGGLSEIIKHKKTGLLTQAGNSDALRDTLRNVFERTYPAREFAAAARVYAREHFAIGDMVEKYEDVYLKLAQRAY